MAVSLREPVQALCCGSVEAMQQRGRRHLSHGELLCLGCTDLQPVCSIVSWAIRIFHARKWAGWGDGQREKFVWPVRLCVALVREAPVCLGRTLIFMIIFSYQNFDASLSPPLQMSLPPSLPPFLAPSLPPSLPRSLPPFLPPSLPLSLTKDRNIKATVFRISGATLASNYIQLPKTASQSLALTGQFLYILFRPLSDKFFVIHLEVATTEGLTVRVSISNLFRELKSTATWLQIPFLVHSGRERGSERAESGSRDLAGGTKSRWNLLVLDLGAVLAEFLHAKFAYLKSIKLCANALVKNVFSSVTEYCPLFENTESNCPEGVQPLPREISFPVSKEKTFSDLYDYVRFPTDPTRAPPTVSQYKPLPGVPSEVVEVGGETGCIVGGGGGGRRGRQTKKSGSKSARRDTAVKRGGRERGGGEGVERGGGEGVERRGGEGVKRRGGEGVERGGGEGVERRGGGGVERRGGEGVERGGGEGVERGESGVHLYASHGAEITLHHDEESEGVEGGGCEGVTRPRKSTRTITVRPSRERVSGFQVLCYC